MTTEQPLRGAVRLLTFAAVRDVIGESELRFELERPCTASELLDEVCRRYPALDPWKKSVRVAVNGGYARPEDAVTFGDEVALIPPVSGG